MFVVIVTLQIKQGQMDSFLPLIQHNAATSLAEEPDCHQFDVRTDPTRPDEVVLYELYTDEAAFQTHLDSAHFKTFNDASAPMVESKEVRSFGKDA